MAETALTTAFNSSAPQDERAQAMAEAQAAAMPSSVPDMMPVVQFMQQQYEEQEMQKALSKPNAVPFPSKAVKEGKPGMQSVWLNDSYGNSMGEWRERWSGMNFDMLRGMVDQTPVLSAVVMTRVRQVQRFLRPNSGGTGPGFQIALKDTNAKLGSDEQNTVSLLQGFFTNNGWERNPRQRARLRRDRQREELFDGAASGIGHRFHRMATAERLFDAQAELVLARRFARVERDGRRRGLARIRLHLGPGQPQRILRIGRIEMVRDQPHAPATGQCGMQVRVERGAPGGPMVAPAVGLECARGERVAEHLARITQAGRQRMARIAPHAGLEAAPHRRFAFGAPQLHHAAGGIAVQRRRYRHFSAMRIRAGHIDDFAAVHARQAADFRRRVVNRFAVNDHRRHNTITAASGMFNILSGKTITTAHDKRRLRHRVSIGVFHRDLQL